MYVCMYVYMYVCRLNQLRKVGVSDPCMKISYGVLSHLISPLTVLRA